MKRRPFATLLGASVLPAGWLVSQARATGGRAAAVLRIGWLSPSRAESDEALTGRRLLNKWLRRSGYDEGRNLFVERRYAEADAARLTALAQDLVQTEVDLIIALHNDAIAAARAATTRIPIVMLGGIDPVELGFVESLARPGANVTGVASAGIDGPTRALQALKDAAPRTRRVAALLDSRTPGAPRLGPATDRLALSLGLQLEYFDVRRPQDIAPNLRRIASRRADALFVAGDPLLATRLPDILAFARRHGLVSVGTTRQFAEAGGMLSVAPDRSHLIERSVAFADRILRGARPQDLPVEEPTRYALVVNLATAGLMGLEVPRQLLQRADEVIE
jgi:putative ABC transport system substrate-binding protein